MNKFDKRMGIISGNLLNKISKIDEIKGMWEAGERLHPQVLRRLKQSVLVTSTGSSTRIEGALLSDAEIEKLIGKIRIQKFVNRDEQEIKGYYELLENVFDSWEHIRLNEGAIKHLHKELLKYVDKDRLHRGEYKKQENKVNMVDSAGNTLGVIFDTTPAFKTPIEMQELVEWTVNTLKEEIHHPLLVIGNFVVEFLAIHPFQDGNGRLSRILTNLLLLQGGYHYTPYVSHEKLIEDNKKDYYIALQRSQKTFKQGPDTILPWLDFFLGILLNQSKLAIGLLEKENIENIFSPQQLIVWDFLQRAKEAGVGVISKETNVPKPTVKQVLAKLLKLKKVERMGLGSAARYKIR